MIVLAIVKISGINSSGNYGQSFDLVWEVFWQQTEACIAVIMVSLTAFRSVFVSNKPKPQRKEARPWHRFGKVSTKSSDKRSSTGTEESNLPTGVEAKYADRITLGTKFHDAEDIELGRGYVQEPFPVAHHSPAAYTNV